MQVILDITKLVNEGKITQTDFERYQQLSTDETEAFLSNMLVGLGVIGLCRDTLMIFMGQNMAIFSLFSLVLGVWLVRTRQQWMLLGTICIVVGIFLVRFSTFSTWIRFI